MLFSLFLAVILCVNAAPVKDFLPYKTLSSSEKEAIEGFVHPSKTASANDLNSSEKFLTDEELNTLTLSFGEPDCATEGDFRKVWYFCFYLILL
jgi:hypothetical protein